ncbi:hypothetical protein ACPCXF_22830 [Lysinibacillus agricola]
MMFFARKRSANAAAAARCWSSGVFTGCEVLGLSSFISAGVWTPAEK